ncbi:hypothetical protein [Nitratidesulfovibrio vulgaris]|uniref:hypothetical protein n=1 Tax=Nitratidesulfovibrio vulgaris TaxID=881 RepID=UPI0013DED1DA|nr:hypothetical protein [Nitratidesulfovibrio vulgaris]
MNFKNIRGSNDLVSFFSEINKNSDVLSLFHTTKRVLVFFKHISELEEYHDHQLVHELYELLVRLIFRLESVSNTLDGIDDFFLILENIEHLLLLFIDQAKGPEKKSDTYKKAVLLQRSLVKHILERNLVPKTTLKPSYILQELNTIKEDVQYLKSARRDYEAKIESTISLFQKELKDRVDGIVSASDSVISDEIKRLKSVMKDFEEDSKNLIASVSKNFEKSSNEEIKNYHASIESLHSKLSENIAYIEEKKKESETLIGIISSNAMSGHYQKVANEEVIKADELRDISFKFMKIALAWSVLMVVLHMFSGHTLTWYEVFFRWSCALLALIPAGYFMAESSKHRNNANMNRKIEVDLASMPPYISDMPEEIKNTIKKECASRVFGPNPIQQNDDSCKSIVSTIANGISELLEKCKK